MVASNSERVILLVQVPPTEDFNSLEHFKTCSHLKSFRTSENFVGSFASISLKTNMFLMNLYYNQKHLLLHNSVKIEYCKKLKRIQYRNFRHFLRGFKNRLNFPTWWIGPYTHGKVVHNFFLKAKNIICAFACYIWILKIFIFQL